MDLSRTKMGTIMIYDKDNTYPIDDRGWVRKKDVSTSTGPTTRVKAYVQNDLPLLQTPRSEGTANYGGKGSRVRISNEFAHLQKFVAVDNLLVKKPSPFDIDFNIALRKLTSKTNDLEIEIDRKLTQIAIDQTVENYTNQETASNKSARSTGSRLSRKSIEEDNDGEIENPEELDESENEGEESSEETEEDLDQKKKKMEKMERKEKRRKKGKKEKRPVNARSDWKTNPKHEKMVVRLSKRRLKHNHLPNLSAGRKAFDVRSYNHCCPVTVHKNRMTRVGY
jgi:hypothetical protein